MCPQTMVAGGDTETSVEIVSNGPDGSLGVERNPVCGNAV